MMSNPMTGFPTIHKRQRPVATATANITDAILKEMQKHELTNAEVVTILLREATHWAGLSVREERERGIYG
jgi:hypothetical protein